ncbi:MAG: hypothetical protein AABX86_00610 [Nanoarchaeota archaeon]
MFRWAREAVDTLEQCVMHSADYARYRLKLLDANCGCPLQQLADYTDPIVGIKTAGSHQLVYAKGSVNPLRVPYYQEVLGRDLLTFLELSPSDGERGNTWEQIPVYINRKLRIKGKRIAAIPQQCIGNYVFEVLGKVGTFSAVQARLERKKRYPQAERIIEIATNQGYQYGYKFIEVLRMHAEEGLARTKKEIHNLPVIKDRPILRKSGDNI